MSCRSAILSLLCAAFASSAVHAEDRTPFPIAITVDDLPAHGPLPAGTSRAAIARAYLAALKAHGVRQAFGFVNAAKIDADPASEEVLRLWTAAGYPLGNHGFTHLNLARAPSLEAWTSDVTQGEPKVARHMKGRDWRVFRYPNLAAGSGERGQQALAFLKGRAYRIADVSVAFSDWSYTDAYARCLAKGDQASIARMKAAYLKGVDDGIARMKAMSQRVFGRVVPQVLLTHLGAWSAETLPDVLDRLDAAGARYVSLEAAQADPAYAAASGLPGGSLPERVAKEKQIDLNDLIKPQLLPDLTTICRAE